MRLIFILLLFTTSITFAQKGFEQKRKLSGDKSHTPVGDFLEIQGEKTNKNTRQLNTGGLSTKLLSKYKVTKEPETGRVLMIENFSKSTPKARLSAQAMATEFLGEVKTTLQIQDPDAELQIQKAETDEIGMTHIQLQQKYKNLPIYGGEVWLHSRNNKIETLNGRNFPTPKLNSVQPQLTQERAIELAMADVAKKSIVQKGISNTLIKQDNTAELLIYHTDAKGLDARLTYYLSIRPNMLERWVYFVDANTGEVLKKFNHTCALDGPFTATARDLNNVNRSFSIQQHNGTYYMIDTQRPMYNRNSSKLPDNPVGGILTIDARNTPSNDTKYSHIISNTGTSWNSTAVSAHYNAGICYDYFRTKFNRNSLDGKGSSIISVINITDEDGKGMDNAYWNGAFMGYGNGNTSFKPLAGALDVAGHEMTHGVVEASARLEYQNQSGALNESFADIFGAMIDRDDWKMGEDVVKAGSFPSGALRDLQNPNQGGTSIRNAGYQPKNMSQYMFLKNTEEEDNGGVHINSGIPNHAFYLFATNNSVGKDRAEQVYYRALTKYLTRTSNFVDARLAVVKAATDLYGDNSAVVNAAKAAFDGVVNADTSCNKNPTPNPTQQNIPVNNGGDFILVFDPTDDRLYTAKATDTNFKPISESGCLSKPSITDDGQYAYFVGKDKNIRRIALTGNYKEDALTRDAVWDNVAVSKDGKRLAGLTLEEEPYIYVFDLDNNNKGVKFKLYNPTYSSGVSTGEALFADSFEWDYSGELIIYDAFNRLSSVSGTIEYWDVGLIRVWDASKKTFGDGKIEKLFTDLEEGESIGNPSLSKNSQNVIAFDYFTTDEPDVYYQIGVDIENNDLDLINENNDIGYPGYSRLDDKMLFNSKKGSQSTVKMINLQQNKISPSGNAQEIFTDAKWAVWYAQGTRALPTKTDQSITFGAITDKNPGTAFTLTATASSKLPVQYAVEAGDATVNGSRVSLGSKAGKVTIQAFQVGNNQFNSASARQIFCIVPATPRITASGSNLVASGGTKYQWYLNGSAVNGLTQSTITPNNAGGTYTVRNVTDDGCTSAASNAIEVRAAILANEFDGDVNLSLYPNPASDELKIELPAGIRFKEAIFYTPAGIKAAQYSKLSANNSVNISQLSKGVYIVQIETSAGSVARKIVRE